MYLQFFELNEMPFSITPDPAFVYLSPAHRAAVGGNAILLDLDD